MDISVEIAEETPIAVSLGLEQPININLGETVEVGGGSDKHYSQQFTNTDEVIVNHGLGKRPSVTVIDTASDEVEGEVTYLSSNSLLVSFSSNFSGTILCN